MPCFEPFDKLTEQDMSHPMNPFDFVPFPTEKPVVKSVDEWFGVGDLKTGYFDVTLKTLTPLHIVGLQDTETDGKRITKSHFLRRGDKAVIPGSTIRGMLRGFMEAACNGWASQMTTHYEKDKGTDDKTGRQIGFHSHYFPDLKELQNNEDETIDRTLKAAL
ncbi:MAG: hypothetical protein KC649_03330, partial [Candidatus Omnitrophica bacterium]|nr:hypothetical protein [Candidatus Omnitrophota bacterium]